MCKIASVLQGDHTRPLQYGFNWKSSGLYPGRYLQYTWREAPTYFFGLKIWVKRSVTYFFWILKSVWWNKSVLRYFSLVSFLGSKILMPGIFLGLKFQAQLFFWVCNMKLPQTPPSPLLCTLRVTPVGIYITPKLAQKKFPSYQVIAN